MGGQALRRSLFHCLNRSPTRPEPSRRNPRCSDWAAPARCLLIIAPNGGEQLPRICNANCLCTGPPRFSQRGGRFSLSVVSLGQAGLVPPFLGQRKNRNHPCQTTTIPSSDRPPC